MTDSGNESDDSDDVELGPDVSSQERMDAEEAPYEVLTTEQVVQYMNDCIREVNGVVEVGTSFI